MSLWATSQSRGLRRSGDPWSFSSTGGPFPWYSVQADRAGCTQLQGLPAGLPSSLCDFGILWCQLSGSRQPALARELKSSQSSFPSLPDILAANLQPSTLPWTLLTLMHRSPKWHAFLLLPSFFSKLPRLTLVPVPGIPFWLWSLELHGACF